MKGLKWFVKDETGAVMVMFSVLLVIILSMTALVVDAGIFYYQKSKLQTALDAAALAAARTLPNSAEAVQVAFEYVEKNGVDSTGVIVEFPSADTVRVRKTLLMHTLFGRVMNVNSLHSSQKAAARYSATSVSLVFPYLLFQGDPDAIMQMGGQFAIEGNIHTNGGVYISGGGLPYGVTSPYGDYRSFINGTVTGGSGDESDYFVANVWNVGKFYYNWWSNNVREVIIHVPQITPPDYDDMIMTIAPVYNSNVFNAAMAIPHVWSMTSSATNFFYKMLSAYYGVTISTNPNTLNYAVPYDVIISNAFSARNHATVFNGSVYFQSGASFTRANTIYGDCYVNGNLSQSGGSTFLDIRGNLYVKGNISLIGSGHVYGDIFCTGNFTNGGGTTLTCDGDVYAGGDVSLNGGFTLTDGVIYAGDDFTTASGQSVVVNGVIIAEDFMDFGGMPVHLNTTGTETLSVYSRHGNVTFDGSANGTTVYGMIYAPNGKVTFGSGNLNFYGSVIADTISASSGGLHCGENTRQLPYNASTRMSLLVE